MYKNTLISDKFNSINEVQTHESALKVDLKPVQETESEKDEIVTSKPELTFTNAEKADQLKYDFNVLRIFRIFYNGKYSILNNF